MLYYHLFCFTDWSLSQLISLHGTYIYSFLLLVAHIIWTLESLDGCRYVSVFNKCYVFQEKGILKLSQHHITTAW